MKYQVREYSVKPGAMQAWIDEWRARVVPLRRRHGFEVLGAWTVDGTDQFVWIIRYDGPKTWQEADAGYYASPERKAMVPDPARHLSQTSGRLMTAV